MLAFVRHDSRTRLGTGLLGALVLLLALASCSGGDAGDRGGAAEGGAATDDSTGAPAPSTSTTTLAGGEQVDTAEGQVLGTEEDGSRSFLGIPYAAPPVGSLRFASPQPAVERPARLDATRRRSACVQETTSASADVAEDCLYLNVYTPDPPAADLPVMVWIHGGSFLTGQGYDYDARQLVTDHDVVVVTINYRLGVLGFLAHQQLGVEADDGASGNHGLDDQRSALRWVRDNVGGFGGDPADLTIFGQSAGGSSGCFHLLSPESEDLFQRAILQSGVCGLEGVPTPTLQQGEASGAAIVVALGCEEDAALYCLRSASVEQLAEATESAGLAAVVAATPIVDGTTLPDQPATLQDQGDVLDVPVIVGSTRDEATVFVYGRYDRTGTSLPADEYPAALATAFGRERGAELLGEYPLAAYPSASQALAAARTDQLACSIDATATALAEHVPTYRYEFADRTAPFSFPETPDLEIGAGHGSELPYLFHSLTYPLSSRSPAQLTPAQEVVSDQLTSAWTTFAATGDPNGEGTPRWEPGDASHPEDDDRLVFTSMGARQAEGFRTDHRCGLWTP